MAYEAKRNNEDIDSKDLENERNVDNNAKNIRAGADIAIASKNPYAAAIGGAIKTADKVSGGKSTDLLAKLTNAANKITPGGKAIQGGLNKLGESGAADTAGTAASMKSGKGGAAEKAGNAAEKAGDAAGKAENAGEKAKNAADNASNKASKAPNDKRQGDLKNQDSNNNLEDKNKNNPQNNTEIDEDKNKKNKDKDSDKDLDDKKKEKKDGVADSDDAKGETSSFKLSGFTKLLIFLIAVPFVLIMFLFFPILLMLGENGEDPANKYDSSSCTKTMSADTSSKSGARYTHYFTIEGTNKQYSLGAVGDIRNHIKTGAAYWNSDGYAIWRGGSTYNGKKYGDDGIDYYIVATATRALIGTCQTKSCSIRYQQNNDIHYFEYGDTFSLEITKSGSSPEVVNAIVLDACGACMDWALSATGHHRTKSTNEISKCKQSSGYKIDFYSHLQNDTTAISDMGYIMAGTTGNTCVGQVDLGNLVVGTEDTKLLQNKSMLDLYGFDGISQLNSQIESNVQKYGSGTGNGVAAAAITLINSLKEKGYRLPYYWGGGHSTITVGVDQNWGLASTPKTTPGGTVYYYNSFDCSGFVSWTIRNGGCTNYKTGLGTSSLKDYGVQESKDQAKAGDILIKTGTGVGHVLVVVQNNNGNIILAESSGGTGGVHFSTYNPTQHAGYIFRDMSGFYASNSCK